MALTEENIILRFQTEATEALAETNKLNDNIATLNTTAAKTEKLLSKGLGNVNVQGLVTKIAQSEGVLAKLQKTLNKANNTNFDQLENELTDIISKVKLTDKEFEVLESNIGDVVKELANIADNATEIDIVSKKASVLTKEFSSAKQELRALTNAISSGNLTGDELRQANLRAGELRDSIGDVNDQINRLASDTPVLDNLGDSMRLAGAGFQIAEGSAALFGDESEELQKSLLKLNAVMAISNGLQDLGTQLTQKGTLANRIAIGVQAAWNIVVGQGSIAMKVFRGAIAATGIGLLIIGLGLLISNWDKVKKTVTENSQAIFDYAKKVTFLIPPINLLVKGIEYLYNNFDKLKSSLFAVDDALIGFFGSLGSVISAVANGDFSKAYDEFKKIGAKTGKAFKEGQEKEIAAQKENAITKALEGSLRQLERNVKEKEGLGLDSYNSQKKLLEAELSLLKRTGADIEDIKDKQLEIELLRANKIKDNQKVNEEKRKEAEEKAIKDREDRLKKELDFIENNANNLEAIARKEIKDAEILADTLNRIELEKNLALNKTKLKFADSGSVDASNFGLEILKIEQQIAEIFKTREPIEIQAIPSLGTSTSLKSGIDAFQEEIDKLKIRLLADPNNADIQAAIDFYISAIERALDGKELGAELDLKKSILGALENGDQKLLDKIIDDGEINALKAKIERLGNSFNSGNLFGADKVKLETELIETKIKLQEKYNDKKKEEAEIDKDNKELQRQNIEDIKNASLDLTNTIINDAIRRKDGEIQIQQERVSELLEIIDQGNTEQVQLEEERLKKLNEEKQRYLNIQRRLAAIEIATNNAIAASEAIKAITKAFGKGGNVFEGIATTIALAASIASTIITVRNAFSDTPAFFEGTEDTSKRNRGNIDGRGGFNAILHPRERVVPRVQNEKLLQLGISNKDLPKYVELGMQYEKMRFSKPQDLNIVSEYKELVKEYKKTNAEIRTLQSIILNSGTRFDITDEKISILVGNATKREKREKSLRR
jgi:hypothetical protein